MPKRLTIRDIARHLGLSSATVSLALNEAPGVNAQTRQRVKEYARRVHYQPNASARAISTGRTHLVAFILARVTGSFFEEIAQGIENVANEYRYDVIVNTVGDDTQPVGEVIERLIGRHIDGLISPSLILPDAAVRRLEEVGIPVVLLRWEPSGTLPYLMIDNVYGGRLAAEYLLEQGHRHILFLGGEDCYSWLRRQGAEAAIAERSGTLECCRMEDYLNESAAYRAVSERIRHGLDFTAIFCAFDISAVGVYRALLEAGLKMPEDISVIGFDDLYWTRFLCPPLTTIHQPQVSQGEAAMRLLVDIMESRPAESRILQPRLVIRDSTGPVPSRSTRTAGQRNAGASTP
jgi:DNA-binding LacI/PurR family transcriptional regulator